MPIPIATITAVRIDISPDFAARIRPSRCQSNAKLRMANGDRH
jgi:hypothetical protein